MTDATGLRLRSADRSSTPPRLVPKSQPLGTPRVGLARVLSLP